MIFNEINLKDTLISRIEKLPRSLVINLMNAMRRKNNTAALWLYRILIVDEIGFSEFEKLYSEKANHSHIDFKILFSIHFLKEFLRLSDQAVLDSLSQNSFHRFVCCIQRIEDIPCRKSLYRFRKRVEVYYKNSGRHLLEEKIISLLKMIQIDSNTLTRTVYRTDSTMIESFTRKISRLELLYLTISLVVKDMVKLSLEVPDALKHYLDKRDYNRKFYHKKHKKQNEKFIQSLLSEMELLETFEAKLDGLSKHLPLFIRLLREQTRIDEKGRRELLPADQLNSRCMLTPFDPEATFRIKQDEHIGYVVNYVEKVYYDKEDKIVNSQIVYFQTEQNIYSDVNFLKDFLNDTPPLEEQHELVADGAYYSFELENLAKEKNFKLTTTQLTGRAPNPLDAEFELSQDGTEFISCPGKGHPKTVSYSTKQECIYLSFYKEVCQRCPYFKECSPNVRKLTTYKKISLKKIARSKAAQNLNSSGFSFFSDCRNGVEPVASNLKNQRDLNEIRFRSLFGTRMMTALKLLVLSLIKLAKIWRNHFYDESACIPLEIRNPREYLFEQLGMV